ncbi:hypothetical protein VTI74DRAFT_3822 [Chaetomium olivicolor]
MKHNVLAPAAPCSCCRRGASPRASTSRRSMPNQSLAVDDCRTRSWSAGAVAASSQSNCAITVQAPHVAVPDRHRLPKQRGKGMESSEECRQVSTAEWLGTLPPPHARLSPTARKSCLLPRIGNMIKRSAPLLPACTHTLPAEPVLVALTTLVRRSRHVQCISSTALLGMRASGWSQLQGCVVELWRRSLRTVGHLSSPTAQGGAASETRWASTSFPTVYSDRGPTKSQVSSKS